MKIGTGIAIGVCSFSVGEYIVSIAGIGSFTTILVAIYS